MDKRMERLIKAVIKLDSEYVNIELGYQDFLSVTSITGISDFFKISLKDIDEEFQLLKDTKYKYEEFCSLCDEGEEDENKPIKEVFDYLEIKKFSEMIVKKIAEGLQERINTVI